MTEITPCRINDPNIFHIFYSVVMQSDIGVERPDVPQLVHGFSFKASYRLSVEICRAINAFVVSGSLRISYSRIRWEKVDWRHQLLDNT